jgi:hypothetical protein
VFGWGRRTSAVLAPPYKRVTNADDEWVEQSLQRQVFHDVLERDEVRVADAEVSLVTSGRNGSPGGAPVTAWVLATDRALHARLELGAGIHRMQRLDYDQVKRTAATQPEERSLTITYWNPRTASDETWHLQTAPTAPSRFAATVLQLVSRRQAARRAAEEASRSVQAVHAPAVRVPRPDNAWTIAAVAHARPEAGQVAGDPAGARATSEQGAAEHPSAGSEVA